MKRLFLLACLAPSLGACASIVEGTDQQVIVNTSPEGARCDLTRDGQQIGVANPTPQTLTLSKSKNDVVIVCNKDGFNEATAVLNSDFESMTLGNLLLGGVIGVGVDAATGALNEYDSQITVPLTPAITIPPAPGPDTIPPSEQILLPQTVPTS
jgi:hypothetical protein